MFHTVRSLHVSASYRQVIRAVRRALKPSVLRDMSRRRARHAYYRQAMQWHADAQRLYDYVQRGQS